MLQVTSTFLLSVPVSRRWKWALSVVLIRSVYMGCCHMVKSGASRVRLPEFESQFPDMLSTHGQDAFSRAPFLPALNGDHNGTHIKRELKHLAHGLVYIKHLIPFRYFTCAIFFFELFQTNLLWDKVQQVYILAWDNWVIEGILKPVLEITSPHNWKWSVWGEMEWYLGVMERRHHQTAPGPHPSSAPHKLCGLTNSLFPSTPLSQYNGYLLTFICSPWPTPYFLFNPVSHHFTPSYSLIQSSQNEPMLVKHLISIFFPFWPLYFLLHGCPTPSSNFMSHQFRLLLLERPISVLTPSQPCLPCIIFSY